MINTDKDKIEELLTKGTEDIFIREHLKNELISGKQLRVKLGIDPTGPAIHLGRAVVLRKLKAFQNLGHKIVLIVGDYTARIGDPSDKLEKRPMLTEAEIKDNLKNYLDQIGKIIDISKTEVHYNSKWLSSMDYAELGKLLECFSVQQMIKRRNFKERLNKGDDIVVSEFIYPALQGYDSLKINSDVEIGGFDQLFNLKAGRTVQKRYGQKEQDIMTLSMLEGTDGRKMSSSWGNIISIMDTPDEMYTKVMEVMDDLIIKYFTLCTDLSLSQISSFQKELESGTNPRDVKMKLAHEIVKLYHGEEKAQESEENFVSTFQKGGIPEEMIEVKINKGEKLMDVLVREKVILSKSDFRRLVDEKAITNLDTDEKLEGVNLVAESGMRFRIGKKRFVKII